MRERLSRDDGFTVAEALVALLLFAILSAAVGSTVAYAVGLTRATEERVTAANLAAEHVEQARVAVPKALVDAGTAVQTVTVGGVAYTVTRRIEPIAQPGVTSSRCGQGVDRTIALRVHLEVTWPDRPQRIAPARSSTVRTINVADAFPNTGLLNVLVDDFAGGPGVGVTVTLNPSGAVGVTNNQGCATFLDLQPRADYAVTLSKSGWVDAANKPTPTRSYIVVRAATTTTESFVFGPASNLLQPPASLTVTQTGCVPGASPTFRAATNPTENAAGQGTLTLAKPVSVQPGDVMLAHVAVRGAPLTSGVTPPSGWTLATALQSPQADLTSGVWFRVATTSDAASYTWNFPTAAAVGGIVAYQAVYEPTPVNASGSQDNIDGNSSTTAPSVTTTSVNTTLVAFWSSSASGTYTVPSSMTKRYETNSTWGFVRGAGAGQPLSASGSTGTRTATATTGSKGIGLTVALNPQRLATVNLSWPQTVSTAATGYRLDRVRAGVVERTQSIAGRATTSATDSPLVSSVNYSFDIASVTSSGTLSPATTRFFTPSC